MTLFNIYLLNVLLGAYENLRQETFARGAVVGSSSLCMFLVFVFFNQFLNLTKVITAMIKFYI